MNTEKQTQNQILEKIEFPLIVNDDFDPVTVTLNILPTVTHEPDPVKHDDGFADLYIILVANWGEERIQYEKYLAKIKKVKVLDWEDANQIRDKYMTVAITNDAYVGQYGNEFIFSLYNEEIDKCIVMFFEIID